MKNLILIKLLLFSLIINAQALNSQFGNLGIVTSTLSNNPSNDRILQAAVQSNDKIIILGNQNTDSNYISGTNGFFSRFYPNGTIDYSFATLGYKNCGFFPSAIAIQSDDKIIVSGRTFLQTYLNGTSLVSRYDANGNRDTSFNCLNSALPSSLISSGKDFFSQSIAIQSDGKILVGGYIKNGTTTTSDIDIALFRFNTDGSLDTTFNTTGYYIITNPSSKDFLFSLAIQSDGKIVAGGSISSNFSCWRFNTNGTPDASFGTNGVVIKDFGSIDVGRSVALVPSTGDILVSGVSNGNIAFVKFNLSGLIVYSQNTTFPLTLTNLITGTTQGTRFNVATTNMKYIDSTHKILISGTVNNCPSLFQFDDLQNGALDANFHNGGGQSCGSYPVNSSCLLLLLSNGNIVTGGTSYNNSYYTMAFEQLDSNGLFLNNSISHFVLTSDSFSDVIELNDSKLLAVNNSSSFAKYNTNGTKDLNYGINGTLGFPGFDGGIFKKQSDGTILFISGSQSAQELYILNADGTYKTYVDPNDGLTYNRHYYLGANLTLLPANVLTTVFPNNYNLDAVQIADFEVESNGKIYIAFDNAFSSDINSTYYLARLNPDFSFDTSFGTNGITSFTFPTSTSYGFPQSLVIQNNGKIVVIGVLDTYSSSVINKFGSCRFNVDGSLDTSFNSTGYNIIPQLTSNDFPYKMIKLSDDSFIINEQKYVTNHFEYDLIKFNSNGELDTTFGTNGILNDDLNQIKAFDFIVLPNNKIIKGGKNSAMGSPSQFKTVCYTSNGTLDSAFGTNGYLTTNINNFSTINNLLLLQNGNLLASGYSSTITNYLATMTQYNLNTMSNEEFVDAQNVFVYPNPAKSIVSFDNSKDNYESVVIYNSLGQEVVTSKLDLTSEHIDVNNLAAGIYILNFKNATKTLSVKLVKE